MRQEPECLLHRAALLGEGPFWDAARNRLLWVDITGKALHLYDPEKHEDTVHSFGQFVGAAVPSEDGSLLLALQDGFYRYDEHDRSLARIAAPEKHLPDNRMNDGKCDPAGRFWAGTMSMTGKPEAGSLYCLHSDFTLTREVSNVSISNGLGWSPDGKTMYHIDTIAGQVYAFDYELATGRIDGRRTLLEIAREDGLPDGMTVDEEGALWIAHWGGGKVSRYDPTSRQLLEEIKVPARLVTSCAFGGPELDELYITTARDEEADDCHGGSLFRVKLNVRGLPSASFRPTAGRSRPLALY